MDQEVRRSFEGGKTPTKIFALMILTNILTNFDHGILPACTSQMQSDFDMDETQLGLLGSIVYLGISLMGMFAGRLYQRFDSKKLTLVALVALQLFLLLFVLSSHKATAYISRFMTGVCQVFLLVYYPIWIDKYGKDKKTMWLTYLQICVPVGIFVGYGMTAVILSSGYTVIIKLSSMRCLFIYKSVLSRDSLQHFYFYRRKSLIVEGASVKICRLALWKIKMIQLSQTQIRTFKKWGENKKIIIQWEQCLKNQLNQKCISQEHLQCQ